MDLFSFGDNPVVSSNQNVIIRAMGALSLKNSAFTLIEMLVVISVIGILSAIIYASFSDSRAIAKNKSLQTELKSVQLALEVYKAQSGHYPPINSACPNSGGFGIDKSDSNCSVPYIGGLVPEYIDALPDETESANSNCLITYQVKSDGSWYKLTAERCLGGADGPSEGVRPDSEFSRCLSSCGLVCDSSYTNTPDFYESYAVYSAGGECRL